MATSTSTLLQIVNEIILNVGERVVNTFDTPTARKAKQYVLEALKEFQIRDDWEFLRDVVVASSWTSPGVALLPTYQRLHAVQYTVPNSSGSAINKVFVAYLDRPSFARLNPTPITLLDTAYFPTTYTILDDDRVQLHPYPSDSTTQARVSFHITRVFTLPTLVTDFLPIPERFTPLIVRLASSLMAARHLGDAEMASMFRNEFESTLRQVRAREQLTPSSGTNMFRRRVQR
jgi:hypothetical protein